MSSHCRIRPIGRQSRGAFTLVELLVVITIIGILVSLLLPAVQSAREQAQEATCRNHVKQLAMACQTHVSTYGYFPGGGWGWGWIGDPTHGSGTTQPGSWIYNILPYIDQQNLHDLQLGKTGAALANAAGQMLQTPLETINCPTRRPLTTYPTWLVVSDYFCTPAFAGGPPPQTVAKTDYACNSGDVVVEPNWSDAGSSSSLPDYNAAAGPDSYAAGVATAGMQNWIGVAKASTGVIFPGSQTLVDSVTDGLTNTYLLGEKYLEPDAYATGGDPGDNENAYMGFNEDIGRWGGPDPSIGNPPSCDTPGFVDRCNFGSCHPNGFNMALCDGSVRMINFSIDITTHQRLCNRHDGQPIDQSKF